jgi:hypothetical protein
MAAHTAPLLLSRRCRRVGPSACHAAPVAGRFRLRRAKNRISPGTAAPVRFASPRQGSTGFRHACLNPWTRDQSANEAPLPRGWRARVNDDIAEVRPRCQSSSSVKKRPLAHARSLTRASDAPDRVLLSLYDRYLWHHGWNLGEFHSASPPLVGTRVRGDAGADFQRSRETPRAGSKAPPSVGISCMLRYVRAIRELFGGRNSGDGGTDRR